MMLWQNALKCEVWIKFYLDRITSAREQGLDVSDCNAEKKSSVNETTSSMNTYHIIFI